MKRVFNDNYKFPTDKFLTEKDITESYPIFDYDIEKWVLGCIINHSETLSILPHIISDYFHKEEHKLIWNEIQVINEQGLEFDMVIVASRAMKTMGNGAGLTVSEICSEPISSSRVLVYFSTLFELYLRRKAIEQVNKIRYELNLADDVFNIQDLFSDAKDEMTASIEKVKSVKTFKDQLDETYKELTKPSEKRQNDVILSGLESLDILTGGFRKGQSILIGARPSVGKTSLVLQILHNIAFRGKTVLMFSLEMPSAELIERLISQRSGLSSYTLDSNKTSSEMTKVNDAMDDLHTVSKNIIIEDRGNTSATDVRIKHKYWTNTLKKRIDIIIIDYIGLMVHPKAENMNNAVGKTSVRLKHMAKEFEIPIITLCQLSRGMDSRGKDAEPRLSDLRDSGSLEQDADKVIFIHRKDIESPITEFIVSKNRKGKIGRVNSRYNGATYTFEEIN